MYSFDNLKHILYLPTAVTMRHGWSRTYCAQLYIDACYMTVFKCLGRNDAATVRTSLLLVPFLYLFVIYR